MIYAAATGLGKLWRMYPHSKTPKMFNCDGLQSPQRFPMCIITGQPNMYYRSKYTKKESKIRKKVQNLHQAVHYDACS